MHKFLCTPKSSLALLAIFVVLGLAACGEGDSQTEQLSNSQFLHRADQICQQHDLRLAHEFGAFAKEKHLGAGSSYDAERQKEMIMTVAMPAMQREAEELRDLAESAGAEPRIRSLLDQVERGVSEVEADAAEFPSRGGPLAAASRLAKRIGFRVCLQG